MSESTLRMRRGAWLVLLLVLLASAAAAERERIVIAGGTSGGSYQQYAVNLQSRLPALRVSYRASKGSGENLELLASGRADIGFAQVDVYADLVRAEPGRFGKIGIIGRLTDECVYVAYRKGGRVMKALELHSEMQGSKPKLAVGSPDGGMNATWAFVRELKPDYDATAIDFTEGTLALNRLASGLLDAVGWVTDPRNLEHKLLRAVRANDDLDIMNFDDPDLVYALPDGTRIYELREVAIEGGFRPRKIRTLCTSSMIFTKPDAAPHVVQAVSDVLSLQRDAILKLEE